MTSPPVAKVFRLTEPVNGTFLVNMVFDADQPRVIDVKSDGSRVEIVEITQSQLAMALSDGSTMALRWRA
jgi:hypothetical protein